MACPDASDLSDFVAGTAIPETRHAIETHLDECEDCRRTVGTLVRSRAVPTVATEDPALAHTQVPAVEKPAALPLPGTRIARYILKEPIGRGGMGVVYAADDPELGRQVAIKLVRPELAESEHIRQRIVREAQAMAKLSHPNVIAVYDAGTADGVVFIAMELVRGENLRRWLAAQRTAAEILEVFLAAGRGLAAAHDAGLVHRDFKPDNVLVGDDGRVRVTDFGLAEPAGDADVPEEEAIVGTPAYMAPEQHAGRQAEPRTDQFSFCVALYEALHGERPFAGKTRTEVARNVEAGRMSAAPPRPRVPGSLRGILLRGLATRPGDRFPTMEELLRALGRDRGRTPRRIAIVAAVTLLIVSVSLFADWIVRERAAAITHTSFAAARGQLANLLAARTDTFTALSDLSYVAPVMTEAAASVDQADFGLGTPEDDDKNLEDLHRALHDATWWTFVKAGQGGDFAVADYKGRLLYASAEPTAFKRDVMTLPVIKDAYLVAAEAPQEAIVRGDDPALIATGIIGNLPRDGLQVVFARATPSEGRPRALFVQIVPGAKLLGDVTLGEGTQIALVAPDGTEEGGVPKDVVAAGLRAGDGIEDVASGAAQWLVQRYRLISPGSGEPIADIVLARRIDVGLAGLFPGARALLAILALGLAALVALGLVEARRRDLSRARR